MATFERSTETGDAMRPAGPRDLGASAVSAGAVPEEASASDRAPQACRLQRATRYRGLCAAHGIFDIDEFSPAATCPGDGRAVVGCATRVLCRHEVVACTWPVCASGKCG